MMLPIFIPTLENSGSRPEPIWCLHGKHGVKQRLIEPTEAAAVNFLAAAVRANSASGDAARIFMGIIRGKLWKNITQANEDRALAALRRYRENNPERFRYREPLKYAA